VLTVACAALLDVGAPDAPHLALAGLLLGLVMWPALAAVMASFSRSVEGAQVAAMPLLLVSMMGSGTFVPFEVMPDRLASVCELLPLSPVITLVRGGWTGNLSAYDALGAVATAVAWTVLAVFAVQRWFRWEPRR
jgi:ABC-2 type transport system permease protein